MSHPLVPPSAIQMGNLSKDPLPYTVLTWQFAHTDERAETHAIWRDSWKSRRCPKTFQIAQDTFV